MEEVPDFEQYKESQHCYYQLKFFAHMQSGETVQAFLSMIDYVQDVSENDQYIYQVMVLLALHVEQKDLAEQHKILEVLTKKLKTGEDMPLILEKYREQGKEEGLKEGLKEGAHLKALEAAQKMLKKGCEVSFISEMLGLSVDEIKDLQDKN